MARLPLVLLIALVGCGGGGNDVDLGQVTGPEDASNPVGVAEVPGDRGSLGAQVALTSGCLACHRLGSAGNDGPGPDLSRVGHRMPASAIRRALLDPQPPMPSFRDLPRREREALVKYLASLR
jgi:ubiquinol-cytochrome c reductase cytochrome b subunit/menaquinol-cytochrome c reductase cytochrome b/c subunit